MNGRCSLCQREVQYGRPCPHCAPETSYAGDSRIVANTDPYVGRVIGERYEVGELISVGGMGRVHRGVQRSLDRAVAIKFIHPHLLTSPDAVSRFMTEARAASRLNHPNVVSVFDFGRSYADGGNDLYIVMELLSGSDLARVIHREWPLSIPRIVDILRQTLLALAEAHAVGITHRDVKPENVFLGHHRGAGDHVKVIDFGIASIGAGTRITRAGQVMGTPAYMAPEQAVGDRIGPEVDQYAVGVMLFEMLTGRLPFDDSAPMRVMHQHASAPRPDPRQVAPGRNIPDALAEFCMRAMAIEPSKRFADATAMSAALIRASSQARPSRPKIIPEARGAALALHETYPDAEREDEPAPLQLDRWRPDVFAWAVRELQSSPDRHGVALHGRPGMGCTFLADAIADRAENHGAFVVRVAVPIAPRCEIRCASLREVIAGLMERSTDDADLADGSIASDVGVAAALRALFGTRDGSAKASDASAALAWAIESARSRRPGTVVLMIDDVDRMDWVSRAALGEILRGSPRRRFRVILTGERRDDDLFQRCATRELTGLSRQQASRIAASLGIPSLSRPDDEIEPLYLGHLIRWNVETDELAPATLGDLLEARIQNLASSERLVLQSIAITGGGRVAVLAAASARVERFADSVRSLERLGFVDCDHDEVRVSHPAIASVVFSIVPRGALELLHTAAAEALERTEAPIELRVHHALRGRADFRAFLLAERAAEQREQDGDRDGAIAILSDALRTARVQLTRGDADAAEGAYGVFARKLGALLLTFGRIDEAYGVLVEALEFTDGSTSARALILEQLVEVTRRRGRHADAERARDESMRIAQRSGDARLIERLSAPFLPVPGAGCAESV